MDGHFSSKNRNISIPMTLSPACKARHEKPRKTQTPTQERTSTPQTYPQRAKHAINDNPHSYAVAKPLTRSGARSTKKKLTIIASKASQKTLTTINGHWRPLTFKKTARSANTQARSKVSHSKQNANTHARNNKQPTNLPTACKARH